MQGPLQFVFLCFCWLSALAALLIFLESCFPMPGRSRFFVERASGTYGVVSAFVPMRGTVSEVEQTIRSLFAQSYPFLELVLICSEREIDLLSLAKEFQAARSHIAVRLVSTPFAINSNHDLIRSLELAEQTVRGRWFVIVDSGVVLDRLAIEGALEFAGLNEISALTLRPGVRCRSLWEKLIAPSREHLARVMMIGDPLPDESFNDGFPFLLLNRESFELVSRVNRMPGILNEAGWSLWGYQVEGLRAFDDDGSRLLWKHVNVRSFSTPVPSQGQSGRRAVRLLIGTTAIAFIFLVGLTYGLLHRSDNFSAIATVAFSAVGYLLMATAYFLSARRIRVAAWFAPVWVFGHIPAAVLMLAQIRRIRRSRSEERPNAVLSS